MISSHRAAIANAYPLESGGLYERTLAWLADELASCGIEVLQLPLQDHSLLRSSLRGVGLILVGDLRPVQGELMLVSELAASPARIMLLDHGYAFCGVVSRICGRCPMVHACPGTDRVALYRKLAGRADAIVYQSPLHREASEHYLGAYPEKTWVIPSPRLPEVEDRAGGTEENSVLTFPGSNDLVEWQNLFDYCTVHPEATVDAYSEMLFDDAERPSNLRVFTGMDENSKMLALSRYASYVQLPQRPVPFGQNAAAMIIAGRNVEINASVGLTSYGWHARDATMLAEAIREAGVRLLTVAKELVEDSGKTGRSGGREPDEPRSFHTALVWAHDLGLGDTINLLPFVRTLSAACGPGNLTFVMPRGHLELIKGDAGVEVEAHEDFDIEKRRRFHDVIIETTVYRDQAFEGDIMDERWIQLQFALQPNSFATVHENLLSLLARAGLSAPPSRPSLSVCSELRQHAMNDMRGKGIARDCHLVLAVHPGAGARIKCWPPDRYAQLCSRLKETMDARIVLVGGPDEDDLVDAVLGGCPDVDMVSRGAPLKEVAALLSLCTAFIGNDSGIMHLACAVGVPVLAIFGPSGEHIWRPAHPVSVVVVPRDEKKKRSRDLKALTVEEVETGVHTLLRRVAGEVPGNRDQWMVLSPSVRRRKGEGNTVIVAASGAGVEVTIDGDAKPIDEVMEACRRPRTWSDLCESFDKDLCLLLLASGILLPQWALAGGTLPLLFSTGIGSTAAGAQP